MEATVGLGLAEDLLERFLKLLQEVESDGPSELSSDLRFLRVRLMREYATLWVEIYSAR